MSTRYTVRHERTKEIVSTHDELDSAIDAAESERTVWLLNPPAQEAAIELVITADDTDADEGQVGAVIASISTRRPTLEQNIEKQDNGDQVIERW